VEVQLRWVEMVSLASHSLYCLGKNPNYLRNWRLGRAQNWSGSFEGETVLNLDENPTTIPGFSSTQGNRKSCFSSSSAKLIFRNAPHRCIEIAFWATSSGLIGASRLTVHSRPTKIASINISVFPSVSYLGH